MRIVYLQYASDPITFFSPSALLAQARLDERRRVGPDVSPELRWYPVVTFLQLVLDMAIGAGGADRPRPLLRAAALYRRLGRR